jgi:hypothetical protein
LNVMYVTANFLLFVPLFYFLLITYVFHCMEGFAKCVSEGWC